MVFGDRIVTWTLHLVDRRTRLEGNKRAKVSERKNDRTIGPIQSMSTEQMIRVLTSKVIMIIWRSLTRAQIERHVDGAEGNSRRVSRRGVEMKSCFVHLVEAGMLLGALLSCSL